MERAAVGSEMPSHCGEARVIAPFIWAIRRIGQAGAKITFPPFNLFRRGRSVLGVLHEYGELFSNQLL